MDSTASGSNEAGAEDPSAAAGVSGARSASSGSSLKLRTVATVGMVADLVRRIGGDQVEVQQLLGSGVDPHLYRPTRDDALLIREADVVFYCGLKLEGKMSDLLTRRNDRRPSVAVGHAIDRQKLFGDPGSDHVDPHIWMDVSMWSEASKVVCDTLAQLRPEHAAIFQERLQELQTELKKLDEYGIQVMKTIPKSKRVLITSHDAFRYLGRRYSIEVEGIQGISTDSEAGLRRIRELVDRIVEGKIEAVFIESSVPRDSIEALVRGAADRGQVLKIGGPLYSDAMGDAGTYHGTYIGMLDHNLTTIASFLGGSPPEGGFRGVRP